jgi:hypothetical protein
MANIRKRGIDQFQVRIRRKGLPELHQTFRSKLEAATWALGKRYP